MSVINRLNTENLKRGINYFKRNGFADSLVKAAERLSRDSNEKDYGKEFLENDVFSEIAHKEQWECESKKKFTHSYKISIVVPAYETDPEYFRDMVLSVINQSYSNWELCIADSSESDRVNYMLESILKEYEGRQLEAKIKYKRISENKGISDNTNFAAEMATGEYIGFMDHDDVLTENALYEIMNVLDAGLYHDGLSYKNRVKLIYSDEDKTNSDRTTYFDWHRKPDFDIDLLRTNNYVCHFLVVRKELFDSVGGLKSEYNGAQDHDFVLRCWEMTGSSSIKHIDKVLYHWRSHESSTATNPESKMYAYKAGKKAVEDHLKRLNIKAAVSDTKHLGFFRVKYDVTANELTKVKFMSLDEYKALEYSELVQDEAEYLMILNNSVKPDSPEFVEEFLGHLKRDEVGCVGGLVIGKNGKIESAGYIRGDEGLVPEFAGLNRFYSGYLHRAKLQRKVDGVCTDCMMVKKSALSEDKTLKSEYIVVYTPYSIFRRIR